MKKKSDSSARRALEKRKMEIANEFDANITQDEKMDGTTIENLVDRAKRKQAKLEHRYKNR